MAVPKRKPAYGQLNPNAKSKRRPVSFDVAGDWKRVALALLYERDIGRCGVCRKRVPIDEATIDHIIPTSKGGLLIASNLQLAHLSCNIKRGAGRLPAQMRVLETKESYIVGIK